MTAGTGRTGVRLRVDFIACDGRGLCAEALPELVTLDDWGFPIVDHQAVPPGLLADVRETIRACPKLALRLEQAHSSWSRRLAPPAPAAGRDSLTASPRAPGLSASPVAGPG